MTKTQLAKNIVSIVIGAGTAKIVSGIVQNNTDPEKVTDQVAIAGAGVVLGMMAADATSNYTDSLIDKAIAVVQKNKVKKIV